MAFPVHTGIAGRQLLVGFFEDGMAHCTLVVVLPLGW